MRSSERPVRHANISDHHFLLLLRRYHWRSFYKAQRAKKSLRAKRHRIAAMYITGKLLKKIQSNIN